MLIRPVIFQWLLPVAPPQLRLLGCVQRLRPPVSTRNFIASWWQIN
jgi:hypothetical protein